MHTHFHGVGFGERAVPRTEPVNICSDSEVISVIDFRLVLGKLDLLVPLTFLRVCYLCLFEEHKHLCVGHWHSLLR